jgi:hypothetical protein
MITGTCLHKTHHECTDELDVLSSFQKFVLSGTLSVDWKLFETAKYRVEKEALLGRVLCKYLRKVRSEPWLINMHRYLL